MLKIKNIALIALFFIGSMGAVTSTGAKEMGSVSLFYNSSYDFPLSWLLGLIHPFDMQKYRKINAAVGQYAKAHADKNIQFYSPKPVTDEQLLSVHTPKYLASLKNSSEVIAILRGGSHAAQFGEKFTKRFNLVPNWLLDWILLKPMRYATGGTIAAVEKALETKSCAINIGGGYHHAAGHEGGGFCYYADINIAVKEAWKKNPNLKVMIVDLDAHQGNGHGKTFGDDKRIGIFDVYGYWNYPRDEEAKKYIKYNYPISLKTKDEEYLKIIHHALPNAVDQENPDLIIYNAGTDVFDGDLTGKQSLSREGILERDRTVFEIARDKKIPIVMTTSGGYTPQSAELVYGSIIKNAIPVFCDNNVQEFTKTETRVKAAANPALDYPDNTAMCVG